MEKWMQMETKYAPWVKEIQNECIRLATPTLLQDGSEEITMKFKELEKNTIESIWYINKGGI